MSSGTAAPRGPGDGGALATTRRWAAMLVLPASILPVLFLGPTLLRAPHKLWREAGAELQRLEEPGHSRGVSAAVSSGPASGSRRYGSSRTAARTDSHAGSDRRLARGASTPRRAGRSSARRPR